MMFRIVLNKRKNLMITRKKKVNYSEQCACNIKMQELEAFWDMSQEKCKKKCIIIPFKRGESSVRNGLLDADEEKCLAFFWKM